MNRANLFFRLALILATSFCTLPLFSQDAPPATPAKPATASAQVATPPANAEAAATEALAKATQNPVASLISVPIQNNSNFAYGPYDRTQDVLNIQPVIPAGISTNWMLITRIIQPIVWQPYPDQNTGGEYGLGDMNPTFFLSPKKPGKLIWGVGPTFIIPTATNDILGQGKFSLGPSVVVLTQPGHWTIGALANNVWSVAGSGTRPPVNQFLLQYFVNYNLKKGWYITSAPILTANWRATSGNVWTVPFGGGVGRIMKLGFQPVNLSATFYGNAVYPSGTSSWSMRLQVAFLFPKLSPEQKKMMMEMQLKKLEQEQQEQQQQKPK
ncbi:MAG TPA: neuromedin U [Candidatus Angelobacter sp.]|nr:neuromedin U [Candidatus Angelobacter sp.]